MFVCPVSAGDEACGWPLACSLECSASGPWASGLSGREEEAFDLAELDDAGELVLLDFELDGELDRGLDSELG